MEFVGLFLEKNQAIPLYQQLYQYFVAEIRAGRLRAGERLPGKRTAAAQLGVSVNTVDEAYQMLAAEGYVVSRERSAFRVARLEQLIPPPPIALKNKNTREEEKLPSDRKLPQGGNPPAETERAGGWLYSMASGDIDTALFPGKMWNRIFREVLTEEPGLFSQGEPLGDGVLREAIAAYLRGYRGVRCDAGQVVVGAGLEVLLGMLARLFPGQAMAVENPGYRKTAQVLHNMGARVLPLAVDAEGMQPGLLAAGGAKLAYLTPSHQFPTGGVMPVGRRAALLQWAAENGGLLIEDDYDSEFRFDGRPLPSLQGLDREGSVVYAGTFSRSLAPGLRAAYLVLPHSVLQRWQQLFGSYACTVWRPEQHTLARFLSQGHFARSLNRMRLAYKQRRAALLQALTRYLPQGSYSIENAHTGLYFILRLPGRDAPALATTARIAGIRVRAVAEYWMEEGALAGPLLPNAPVQGDALMLGYGGLSEEKAEQAVSLLAGVLACGTQTQ